jgi:hypothetical protein
MNIQVLTVSFLAVILKPIQKKQRRFNREIEALFYWVLLSIIKGESLSDNLIQNGNGAASFFGGTVFFML